MKNISKENDKNQMNEKENKLAQYLQRFNFNYKKVADNLINPIYSIFYSNIIDEKNENNDYCNYVGLHYQINKNYEKAEIYYQKALLNGNIYAERNLAIIFMLQKKFNQAIILYEKLAITDSNVLGELITCYKINNEEYKVLPFILKHINEKSGYVTYMLSSIFDSLGAKNHSNLLTKISADKGNEWANREIGEKLFKLKDFSKALEYFIKLERVDIEQGWTIRCYIELGDTKNASDLLNKKFHLYNDDILKNITKSLIGKNFFDCQMCCYLYKFLNEEYKTRLYSDLKESIEKVEECNICMNENLVLKYGCRTCNNIYPICISCLPKIDKCYICMKKIDYLI